MSDPLKLEDFNLGPYTMHVRNHYIAYRIGKYLIDHPDAKPSKASKYARVAWSRKVKEAEARLEKGTQQR